MPDQARANSPFGATQGRLLLAIAAVAVIVGVFARFKGLNLWPLGPDEYYFARSVQNILQTGLPEYPCGGYYERGIVLQYLTAGLQLLGLSAEHAPRFLAAVSSLVALPAVYLLGRKVHGVSAGLLAVSLVAFSVWEIEMARFGRMYAPFQAVFLWYLIYFLRYAVDRQVQALRGMVLLSYLGVLVWEGGVLLIALNLLPPFINHERGRLSRAQWRYLVLMGLLMLPIFLYWYGTASLRMASDVPALPPDFDEVLSQSQTSDTTALGSLWRSLTNSPLNWTLGLIPVLLAGWALPWIWGFRQRRLAAVGLVVMLAAALAHQFLVVGATLVFLLLAQIADWREFFSRPAWRFHAAIFAAAIGWVLVGLQSPDSTLVTLAYELFGFPDVLDMVARPWARAVPWLALSILLMLGVSAARAIFRNDATSTDRVLLIVAMVMLLLVGIAGAPRVETRYTFFLYPLFLVIAIGVLIRAVEQFKWQKAGTPLLRSAAVLGWFMLTEDFQPRHLMQIDSAEITFRHGMSKAQGSHYYGRNNVRATADWLRANVNNSTDLVVSGPGVTALDFYYPEVDLVYVDPNDQRLRAWSCHLGTVERWSNLPLEHNMAALQSRISAEPRTYIVVAARELDEFVAGLQQFSPTIVRIDDYSSHVIVVITRQ